MSHSDPLRIGRVFVTVRASARSSCSLGWIHAANRNLTSRGTVPVESHSLGPTNGSLGGLRLEPIEEMVSSTFKGDTHELIPAFSIVIGVYNDWAPLEHCLQSLAHQVDAPSFEVIVIDDGSDREAPEFIRSWGRFYPLMLIAQSHFGISAARNRGIKMSSGSALLFTDADCRFAKNCLVQLDATMTQATKNDYFQLHLSGDCSTIIGKTEELRLITLQNHLLQPDGCIRYLNTAGFAVRRAKVNIEDGLFNPSATRAEDTLLLATLIQTSQLPLFVPEANIEHSIPLSFLGCLRKDLRSAYLEERIYDVITAKGVKIRVTYGERLRMLLTMWKTSKQASIGRSAWLVLTVRQALRRMASLAYRCVRRPGNDGASQSLL